MIALNSGKGASEPADVFGRRIIDLVVFAAQWLLELFLCVEVVEQLPYFVIKVFRDE